MKSSTRGKDSLGARSDLRVSRDTFSYFRLDALSESGIADISRLPCSLKILIEAVMRAEDGSVITKDDVEQVARYRPDTPERVEIPFKPSRVLLQDFTGVPCVVDLAAMRSAMKQLGGDPKRINPRIPVDLVIDHSVQVDFFNSPDAFRRNSELEFQRNRERYEFLAWGQQAFENFSVIPPASGICHQVNLEYLGSVVRREDDSQGAVVFPDTLVGTDSHTPMINGLGVVGWGVGGIEAEAVMLGQPLYMPAPEVIGVRLTGALPEGATATDLVLSVTELLRREGVVGKFVEFFGPGLSSMSVPDRATIANMTPECGSTVNFFPVDQQTLAYMRGTGRPESLIELVETYCKSQGLFRTDETPDPVFSRILDLDLSVVEPCLAGPKRPHDRVRLADMREAWHNSLSAPPEQRGFGLTPDTSGTRIPMTLEGGQEVELAHGHVFIAAITSCTNTSNPSVLIGAGLLARKAVDAGLTTKPWVKTSLAPGSPVVTAYLDRAGLSPGLDRLGFHLVGYGCTTCIGNSGPLPEPIAEAIRKHNLVSVSVLSGNRNFEGRINPLIRASYLASPMLVVAYALAGTVDIDLEKDPLGHDRQGNPVFLADIWPAREEIAGYINLALDPETYRATYGTIETSNEEWNRIPIRGGDIYNWSDESTYIQHPPFFADMNREPTPPAPIHNARVLIMVGDSVTTDHISPAGSFPADGPAGEYLVSRGVEPKDFNSFGSRRGNDRVMTRGTFANIRLRNRLAGGREGGWTRHLPSDDLVTVHEAAGRYREEKIPCIVIAGREYGMGSSRDWAAKGTLLLGVRAVIAESFERIHRSNLVGMGVLPLLFEEGENAGKLGLDGSETYSIDFDESLQPGQLLSVAAAGPDGGRLEFSVRCRLESQVEVEYFLNGGILQTVLRQFLTDAGK